MRINFYTNDGLDRIILSLYDIEHNPFKVGDEINLSLHGFFHKKSSPEEVGLFNEFHNAIIRLDRDFKTIRIDMDTPEIIIEYYCSDTGK